LYNPSATRAGDIGDGVQTPDPSETYELYEVSTAVAELQSSNGSPDIFIDLAKGTKYGSRVFTRQDNGSLVSISMSPAAIDALNRSRGLFAFGGVVTTLGDHEPEQVFAFTAGPTGGSTVSNITRRLVVETSDGTCS
jgi:hypothetical protein